MQTETPNTIYLKNYTAPAWLVDTVDLHVAIHQGHAEVRARLACRRNPQGAGGGALVLNGESLALQAIALDGAALDSSRYTLPDGSLVIAGEDSGPLPDAFMLETVVRIEPDKNTRLAGLYRSRDGYFTQCESEGFRRITFFPDRPDVMARYSCTIEADRERFPQLLSNGNLAASGASEHDASRHWARWEDPFPKPSYLFALVAAKLDVLDDHFVTRSGRTIRLAVHVEPDRAPGAGDEVVLEHVELRGDQREQVGRLGERVFPARPVARGIVLADAGSGQVAVGQELGEALAVGRDLAGVARHHVGAVGEEGDAAETFGLALGEVAVPGTVEAGEPGILVRLDAHHGLEREGVRQRSCDRQRVFRLRMARGVERCAVERDHLQCEARPIQHEGAAGALRIAPAGKPGADFGVALVDRDMEIDRVDQPGGGRVVLEVDRLRGFGLHGQFQGKRSNTAAIAAAKAAQPNTLRPSHTAFWVILLLRRHGAAPARGSPRPLHATCRADAARCRAGATARAWRARSPGSSGKNAAAPRAGRRRSPRHSLPEASGPRTAPAAARTRAPGSPARRP